MRRLWAAALLLAAACGRRPSAGAGPSPVRLEGDAIVVQEGTPLHRNLSIIDVPAGHETRPGLRLVGQIVALANPDGLSGDRLDWVELDHEFTGIVGLDLARLKDAKPGEVVGYTEMPLAYAKRLVPGERVTVERYGMTGHGAPATVLFARLSVVWGQAVPVLFRMNGERGWLPGASCEVIFPRLSASHVHIPTTALLHEGIREYVLKETGPGRFVPSVVTIGDGDTDVVEAMVGVEPKDRILARGAILLKPLLHDLLLTAKKGTHDRP